MMLDGITLAEFTVGATGAGTGVTSLDSATSDDGGLTLLPVLRWAETTGGLTSRVDDISIFDPSSWFQSVPATITGALLNMGNSMWAAAANFQKTATSGILDTVGPYANQIMGTLYTSLSSNWIIFTIPAIIAIVSGLWAATRGRGTKELVSRCAAVIVGVTLFTIMGATSAANTTTAAAGTPWWMVKTATSVISDAGGDIADDLLNSDMALSSGTFFASTSTSDLLSCRRYLAELDSEYSEATSDYGVENVTITTINRLWEETGLRIWARQQYGSGENGSQVFCRVLEARAGATAQAQFTISDNATGGYLSKKNEEGWRGIAWWPNLMYTEEITSKTLDSDDSDGDDDSSPMTPDDAQLDRLATIFDVCGMKSDGTFQVRSGWSFVNSIEGDGRGVTADDDGGAANLQQECRAAITATTTSYGDYPAVTSNGTISDSEADTVSEQLDAAPFNLNTVYQIVSKFDVSSDVNWEALAYLKSDSTEDAEAAIATMHAQQGDISLGDIGGALVFALSGVVNLLIWGIGLGVIRMFTTFLAAAAAVGGIGLGALILAFAPEKGQQALKNAVVKMFGMCAGATIISIAAAVGCIFTNAGMMVLGLFDDDGNTMGSTMTLTVASMLLPVVYLFLLKWLCTDVWRIGNPFSAQGMRALLGGNVLGGALRSVGGAVAGGAAAAWAGGGLTGAIQAAAGALSSGGHGGIAGAVSAGLATGRRESAYRNYESHGKHSRNGLRESGADESARSMPQLADGKTVDGSDQDKQLVDGGGGASDGVEAASMSDATLRLGGSEADWAAVSMEEDSQSVGDLRAKYAAMGLEGHDLDAAVAHDLMQTSDGVDDGTILGAYRVNRSAMPGLSDSMAEWMDSNRTRIAMETRRLGEKVAGKATDAKDFVTGTSLYRNVAVPAGRKVSQMASAAGERAARMKQWADRNGVTDAVKATGRLAGGLANRAAEGAVNMAANHPVASTAALVGLGLAVPGAGTAAAALLGSAGVGVTHSALNSSGFMNRGYHAARNLATDMGNRVERFASSDTARLIRENGTTMLRPVMKGAAVAANKVDSALAGHDMLGERTQGVRGVMSGSEIRDRVFSDAIVNLENRTGGLDDKLNDMLVGDNANAINGYAQAHPESRTARLLAEYDNLPGGNTPAGENPADREAARRLTAETGGLHRTGGAGADTGAANK